ncbi:hypothetical protein EDB83DRAFT_2329342 [Lactarius deliciosus]|nr:hypothetical protein EDB83DRAFT_2329342 [Lactarius deliciosus]
MMSSRLLKPALLHSLHRHLDQLRPPCRWLLCKFLLWGQVQVRILAPWPLWLRLPYQAPHGASRRGFSQSPPVNFTCSLSTAALIVASCSSVPSAAPPVHRVLLCWTSRGHVRLPWTSDSSCVILASESAPLQPLDMSSHSFARWLPSPRK